MEASPPQPPSKSFVKAFIPGLIAGLVAGGFAGAFLTPLLDSSSKPVKGAKTPATKGPVSRDETHDQPPLESKPPESKPEEKPKEPEKPADKP